ncbi:MAG TPA: ABC transporter substrate-binding protein [Thermomicrobiales bacterium]|jgi:NitT/TauT family transport system substrate-binding protein|nr:hypothetical protein [Chloroflexota bacterium]HBY47071.1 hypothetical protein [Chloroflexota bacterium]HCG30464.1 hypothetical protein [Chloroflexota bacterium]HQZ88444.1 ABC transporter substrate-binding protein [Thermomicrobiales bacterium]HRA30425.1 ABC transporter substrate-binding protein [Thermomicrobiales bacterium]
MNRYVRVFSALVALALVTTLLAACGGASTTPTATTPAASPTTVAQATTTTPTETVATVTGASSPVAEATVPAQLTKVTVGFIPVLIFAPVMLAHDKGYFADYGLDVQLEPLAGGSDMVVLTANGNFDIGLGGTGPAFFNAVARGIDLTIVSPLHFERGQAATPLVVSKKRYDSGELTKPGDLKGKKVSVNARGATEYWLDTALRTDGLTIADVDLQTLPFPDVAAALDAGALDGAMLGEPLVTQAEKNGLVVRLKADFPENFQPTFVWVNPGFATKTPDLATGFMAGMLRGCRDLWGDNWDSDENLAILNKYTKVPPDLIREAARTYCEPNGEIHADDLNTLQTFFKGRGLLEYDTPLDVEKLIDRSFAEKAVKLIGVAEEQ